jgi:integrase
MQVSKWLGHASFVLTLTTYADYIREDELAGPNLARLAAAAKGVLNTVAQDVQNYVCLMHS